nr:hypothetical protein [Burkholderia stagnalis]
MEFTCVAAEPLPIAIELAPPVAAPPPAEYCACAATWNKPRYVDAISTASRRSDGVAGIPACVGGPPIAVRFAALLDDTTRLPHARSSSDAATQAPNASFQTVLNDLFIFSPLVIYVPDDAIANASASEDVPLDSSIVHRGLFQKIFGSLNTELKILFPCS